MEKLYVIVRNDLSPGLQCAQACHAQHAFITKFPERAEAWKGNLVVLQVSDEKELNELYRVLQWEHYPRVRFKEPDLGGQLTAIATSGDAYKWLSNLPLALRTEKTARAA